MPPDQERTLERSHERWLDVGRAGAPASRSTVEEGIGELYDELGIPRPAFIWLRSPCEGALAAVVVPELLRRAARERGQLRGRLRGLLRGQPWDQLGGQRGDKLRDQLGGEPGDQLRDQLEDQLGGQLGGQLRAQLEDLPGDQYDGQCGDQLRAQYGAQLELRDQLLRQLRAHLRQLRHLRWLLRGQLWDQLEGQLGAELWGQFRGQLEGQLGAELLDQLGAELWGQLWGQLEGQFLDHPIRQSRGGQHDVPWIAFYDVAEQELAVNYDERSSRRLRAWRKTTGGGWWWPFRGFAILTERPRYVSVDDAGRLHSESRPAVLYEDGFDLWAWHGLRVERDLIEKPIELAQIRSEHNLERRRMMVERYGHDRYLRDAGAKLLDEDEWGRLWRLEEPDDEPIVMVEVVNSTAEPDGTYSVYWLRVPPESTTARGAVAWSFDVPEGEYAPVVQT